MARITPKSVLTHYMQDDQKEGMACPLREHSA